MFLLCDAFPTVHSAKIRNLIELVFRPHHLLVSYNKNVMQSAQKDNLLIRHILISIQLIE
jgi:hypothetical protein